MKLRQSTEIEDFGTMLYPEEALEPILAKPVRESLLHWLTEIWAAGELQEVGLEARQKALFTGPPGGGKTTLGHHLSARLGLPMLAVLPDRIMTSYVSESAASIGRLFDLVSKSEPCVLFLDEFDSIGQKRMGAGQNPAAEADHNHMVNTLLRRFDEYYGYVIAATNREDQIDPALWRRFEIQIKLDVPGQFERERILARYLHPFGLPKSSLVALGEAFATASPALMRQFCEGLKRQIVVGKKADWDMRREPTIGRLLAAVAPHPDLGLPRLWSLGAADASIKQLPWPLPLAADIPAEEVMPRGQQGSDVINFASRKHGGE